MRLEVLPRPNIDGATPLEATLRERRSEREFSGEPLSLADLSQLLWAAQGISRPGGQRTAPSAGATYPNEQYVAVWNVDGLGPGLYKYRVASHDLVELMTEDLRDEVGVVALGQNWLARAPAVIVIAAAVDRTAARYGQRAVRYVHMEVGGVTQNIYLQATALELGTVFVGAFSDTGVKAVLRLPENEHPLAIMPVGRIR
jgi:SagB-type dehydrogenase family enzyme